ncbi:MAG: hypothetical protein JWR19_825 [Pedosphaera sp.]|nr:hypothetical protein [Pedosphaera sp.]
MHSLWPNFSSPDRPAACAATIGPSRFDYAVTGQEQNPSYYGGKAGIIRSKRIHCTGSVNFKFYRRYDFRQWCRPLYAPFGCSPITRKCGDNYQPCSAGSGLDQNVM